MKNILFILLIISQVCFAQNPKLTLTKVTLENNILKNYFKDGSVITEGEVIGGGVTTKPIWLYDSILQSIYSVGSNDSSTENGRWNFTALPLAGRNLNNQSAYNIYIGPGAGQLSKISKNNIGLGWEALKNSNGADNVGISEDALLSLVLGAGNNAIGRGALIDLVRGNKNNAFGYNALQALGKDVSGAPITSLLEDNVAIGPYAGAFLNKGNGNVFIGAYAGEMNDADDGKTINNTVYIGNLTGITSAHSNSISIGYNIQSTADGGINIGNVYYAENGKARVNSLTISGREITADDNYLYVKTSTGVVKKISLDAVAGAPLQQPVAFKVYDRDGRLLIYQPVYKN